MSYYHSIYRAEGLTESQIQSYAPSVFAQTPWNGVSDKYTFIPTYQILDQLQKQGLVCVSAKQSTCRIAGKQDFTRHQLRFRLPQANLFKVGDVIPELALENSHDRSSSYNIMAAFMRCWCSNQCLAPLGQHSEIRMKHMGSSQDVIDATYQVIEELPAIGEKIQQWKSIEMNPGQQLALAEAALGLRWDENQSPLNPTQLLTTRRAQDRGSDLFTTYQKIQENLIKGGMRGINQSGKRAITRSVTSVKEDTRLNKALWKLTEKMEELLVQ